MASTTTRFFDDSQRFAAVAEILPGVTEPTVPIYYNGALIGGRTHHAVELYDRTPNGSGYPGTFVDLVANTYVRATWQTTGTTRGDYGTSFAATFSYRWAAGGQTAFAYIPTVDRGDVTIGGSARYRGDRKDSCEIGQ